MKALPTPFLSTTAVSRIVQTLGIEQVLESVAAHIREDFLRWPEFDKTARVASHCEVGVIELMPISDARDYAFKYVNGHPGNGSYGLPTVMAFGVLADVATGVPRLISELTLTTAIRTAAMSALAARTLARPGSRTMALIGNGAQAEFQAIAFRQLVGVTHLRVFDIDPRATAKLVRNLRGTDIAVEICTNTRDAVRGADIVTTATADKTCATILAPEMIEPGMHINAIGGDCPGKTELHADVLRGARVFVEYAPQTRIEGDIQQLPADFPVTELWRVLSGDPGRCDAHDVTVFDSVGFALEDYSALRFMAAAARRLGLGETLALVPQLDDPKDLFGAGVSGIERQAAFPHACGRRERIADIIEH